MLWAMVSVSAVRDQGGQLRHFTAIVKDIGKRKAAEDARHRSEVLYRTVAKHFPRGIVGLFDENLRLLLHDGNRSAVAIDPLPTWSGSRRCSSRRPRTGPGSRPSSGTLAGESGHVETRPNGRIFEVSTYPVRDEDGKGRSWAWS